MWCVRERKKKERTSTVVFFHTHKSRRHTQNAITTNHTKIKSTLFRTYLLCVCVFCASRVRCCRSTSTTNEKKIEYSSSSSFYFQITNTCFPIIQSNANEKIMATQLLSSNFIACSKLKMVRYYYIAITLFVMFAFIVDSGANANPTAIPSSNPTVVPSANPTVIPSALSSSGMLYDKLCFMTWLFSLSVPQFASHVNSRYTFCNSLSRFYFAAN